VPAGSVAAVRSSALSRRLATLESAERKLQQLFVEQREQVVENRLRLRFGSVMDVIEPSYHRRSVSGYGRCSVWIT
jgi:hypothetical protein